MKIEVWCVEKNKETASSKYSRGDSFGLHENLSLYNSYRIGRLGAKPELGSIFIIPHLHCGKIPHVGQKLHSSTEHAGTNSTYFSTI